MDIFLKKLITSEQQNVEKIRISFQILLKPVIIKFLVWSLEDKNEDEFFYDYFARKKIEVGNYGFFSKQIKILKNNKTPESFDITLLAKLIKLCYEKNCFVELVDSKINKKRKKIIDLIFKIRDMRNTFAHESSEELCSKYGDGRKLESCEEMIKFILETSGEIYGFQKEASECESNILNTFSEVKLLKFNISNDEYTAIKLNDELRAFYSGKNKICPLGFCNLNDVVLDIAEIFGKLKVVEKFKNQPIFTFNLSNFRNNTICFEELLKPFENNYNYIILVGDAGSGKSTICLKLLLEFMTNEYIFYGISKFDFVF